MTLPLPTVILTEGGNPVLSHPPTRQAGNPPHLVHKNTHPSPLSFSPSLPTVILAEGGNPECGLGLDSRGGHENDGKRKTRTTQGMTLPLPAVILTEGGNPVLFFPIRNWIPGQGPRRSEKEGRTGCSLPSLLSFSPAGGNPECGLGLDSRVGHENDGGEGDDGGRKYNAV